eukprot:138388-Rhodomonas_salina.1
MSAIQNRPPATEDLLFEEAHSLHTLLDEEVPEPGQTPKRKHTKKREEEEAGHDAAHQLDDPWTVHGPRGARGRVRHHETHICRGWGMCGFH